MNTETWIIHICPHQSWLHAQKEGFYQAPSFAIEGFIHCSRPDQILKVANHYYPARKDLVLLWIDPAKLTAELRWEPVGTDVFPHVYGLINLEAVRRTMDFEPDSEGIFRTLPEND